MSSRITLTTVITGPIAGLKRVVKEFLSTTDIGCILQTTMIEVGNNTTRLTMLTMEGEKEKLIETRDLLELSIKFAGIKYDAWEQNDSDKPWPTTQTIKPTPGSLTRHSSGFVEEEVNETYSTENTLINDRIIEAAKALGGHIIKAVNHTTPLLVKAAETAGEIKQVYSRASSLTEGLVKNAWFSYHDTTVLLNTQACLDWALLVQEIEKVFQIAANSAVKVYEKLADGTLGQIIEISGIEAKGRYYVQTDADALQKVHITTMEQFFEKLMTDQNMSDAQVAVAKEKFGEQGFTFKQLMATGGLSLTDADLQDYGMAQGGLRKAILAVIKSNQ